MSEHIEALGIIKINDLCARRKFYDKLFKDLSEQKTLVGIKSRSFTELLRMLLIKGLNPWNGIAIS